MSQISGITKVLAVYGDPVSHSLSPLMHNAALTALGWNCVYLPFQVSSTDLGNAVQAIRTLGFKGVNLTIPHKQSAAPFLDEVCGDALATGSVNTIVNRNDKLYGFSTDGLGLIRSLKEDGSYDVRARNVLLLGAGGSAAAVVYSLINAGIKSLTIANRTIAKASSLVSQVQRMTGFEIGVCAFTDLANLDWDAFDLLINTTAVGLGDNQSPLAESFLRPHHFVYDLVYQAGGTTLVHQARRGWVPGVNRIESVAISRS